MPESAVLELAGVSFAYGKKMVLQGVDLAVTRSGLWGIVGPNGCGKTTLVDLAAGLRTPLAGRVRLWGRDLASYRRRQLALALALVPQEFEARFPFTVQETVAMGRHPYLARFAPLAPSDHRAVEWALARTGLDELRSRPIVALSGGERQRVVLARALAQDAPLLILDEPTSSQDVRHRLTIMSMLRELVRRHGKTVLTVTHDLNLAGSFCDHMVLLHQGRVHAAGPTAQVLTPENIAEVFGVHSRVFFDDFSQTRIMTFRAPEEGR